MELISNFHILKRAALTVALFFAIAIQAAPTVETYRDIIEKAHNLSLQKDRIQAVTILLGALKKESKKSVAQRELLAALDQVSKIFYSDKAQQLYELGLSLKSTDPNLALSRLQEAARLEPENLSIEIALARFALSVGDCDGAEARILSRKELFPAVEELKLLAAQTALCASKLPDYAALRTPSDFKSPSLGLHWHVAEAEYLLKMKAHAKASEMANLAQKSDPGFPEAYYWQWKTAVVAKEKSGKVGQKYLNLCKGLNSAKQRLYSPEPQLCRRISEVETFLKKNNNTEI